MARSFALTFAAASLRVQLPVLGALGVPEATAYAIVAWASWVPNLVLVSWWLRPRGRAPGTRRAMTRSTAGTRA